MMSQGGPNFGAPPAQARAEFEGLLASVQIAPISSSKPRKRAACADLWVDAPGVRADRVLLYLHGGGYVSGSANGLSAAGRRTRPRDQGARTGDRLSPGAGGSVPGGRRRYRRFLQIAARSWHAGQIHRLRRRFRGRRSRRDRDDGRSRCRPATAGRGPGHFAVARS